MFRSFLTTIAIIAALFALATKPAIAADNSMTITVVREFQGQSEEVQAGGTVYVEGQVSFKMDAPMDGHIYFFSCGPDGDVFSLVPSEPYPDTTVRKGEGMTLGPFPVVSPAGLEKLVVVFSSQSIKENRLLKEVKRFFTAWNRGEDMSGFSWSVGGGQIPNAQTRGIDTKIHYETTADGESTVAFGMVVLQSVKLGGTGRPRCGPTDWGTRGACGE